MKVNKNNVSTDPLQPVTSREERQQTGRYAATAAVIVFVLLGLYHTATHHTVILAGLIVPAIIMLLYVSWILRSATRESRRQRLLRQALQQIQLNEVITEPANNVISNAKTSGITTTQNQEQQLKLNHVNEQCKTTKLQQNLQTPSLIAPEGKTVLNNSPLVIAKFAKNDNLEKNVRNVNTSITSEIELDKSSVSNLINNKPIKNKTRYKSSCSKLKCVVQSTNLTIPEVDTDVKYLKLNNETNMPSLAINENKEKNINEEKLIEPAAENVHTSEEHPVSRYKSRLKKPELIKVHATVKPGPQSLGRSYSIA